MYRKLGIRLFILLLLPMLAACASVKPQEKQRAQATRDLGEAYMRQGSVTKGLREFLKAEQIYADDPYLQNDLGVAYMSKGSLDLAVEHYKKALKLKPEYSPARNNLGTAYLEQENWNAAIECFKKVKDDILYGTPHFPMTNLGFVYFKLGDYDQSVQYYKQAIDIAPNFAMAYHGIGNVYLAMGKYDKAVESLETAVEKAPNQASILMDLGKAYKKIHKYNKAHDTFMKAVEATKDPKIKKEAQQMADEVWKQ